MYNFAVAPYAGAWIEICPAELERHRERVAPYAGAWIEICGELSPVTG